MSEVIFSEAHVGDEETLAAFHQFDDPSLFTHEYWQYHAEESLFIVGKDGDRIIATEALMPYFLSVQGTRMLTGRSERTLVDVSYRGQNIWPQLMSFCASRAITKKMLFVWGNTDARKAFEKVGFKFLTGHRLHMFTLVSFRGIIAYIAKMMKNSEFNPRRICANIIKGDKAFLRKHAMLCAAIPSLILRSILFRFKTSYSCHYEIKEKPYRYSDMDALYRRLGILENDIYLIQNEQFVKWMLINSNHCCQSYYAYLNGQLVGYTYVDFINDQVATIIDFAFEDNNIAKALLKHVHNDLADKKIVFVNITINFMHRIQKKYLFSLVANGYVPLYRGGSHIVLPLCYKNDKILNDISRWYLTDLWYMLYKKDK